MLLYFEDKRGQRRIISNPTTVKDMWKDINNFLAKNNYEVPYTKVNFNEKEWIVDVGSHNECFVVKDFDEEDYNEMIGGKEK